MKGFTLLEMVVVMVLMAILVAGTVYFTLPVQQAVDVTVRAEMTDMADNALQRIRRDVRLALPNSLRVTTSGSALLLEYMPLRTAGRYRAESSGAGCGSGNDALVFDASDDCFASIGPILNFNEVVTNADFLVLNNYGRGFDGQNVYDGTAPANRRTVTGITASTVTFTSGDFRRKLHDSPGRRFFIVGPPVTYKCDPAQGTLTRHTGYLMDVSQPTAVGTGVTLATFVSDCVFNYSEGVAAHVGLLSMRLTLSKGVSTGTETISLYQAVHITNVP
jgi:MSHA biogenesis protein MshO